MERPAKMPIAADWPEEMYRTHEVMWYVVIAGQEQQLSDLEISLVRSRPQMAH